MKRIFLFIVLLNAVFIGILNAQETTVEETTQEASAVADADNPGMAYLDQATEAKLQASTVLDLSQVIVLCQRAKRAGLSGENLKYCDQLLASSQLQRGLFFAQSLLGQNNARPENWQEMRQRALGDLEEATAVIKDQPTASLRIAQLNLLPDGNENRAKAALQFVAQNATNEPELQMVAIRLLADLEPEAEQREAVLATAAKSGNPQILLLHALTLLEMNRREEASAVLKKLVADQSSDPELRQRVVAVLIDVGEYDLAINVLDTMSEKETDNEQKDRIKLMKAQLFAKKGSYDEALKLLNTPVNGNPDLTLSALLLRSDVHLAMDNPESALKDIETAEKMRPNAPPVLEAKYAVMAEQKRYDEALAIAQKLQTVDAKPQNFLREILVLNELGKYDESVDRVEKLIAHYPDDNAQWTMVLVEIYSKQKSYDKAMALVEEQLKADSEGLRWIAAKAKILSSQKKWDEAVHWLETYLKKESDSSAVDLMLIELLFDKKDYKAARERLRPLLEKNPNNLILLHLDSQALISLGIHSEAVNILTKLVEADPGDYTSINNLAWVLCTSPIDLVRNGSRAVELAEQAGKLTQYKKAFILSTMAAAYAESGDFAKAREWSQKSIDAAKTEKGKTEEERQELLEHLQKEWDCFQQDMPFRELKDE